MYGKRRNSYGNLVSELKGQLISAQSLLCIIYTYWQNLNMQGHPTTVFSQMRLNAVLGYPEFF